MWIEVVNFGVHWKVICLCSFHWGIRNVILQKSFLLGFLRILQLSSCKVQACEVLACILEAEWGEDDWRSQHLICICSLNHLVFNTVPWSLIVLMFPFPKNKIRVYLLVCKDGYRLAVWSWERI